MLWDLSFLKRKKPVEGSSAPSQVELPPLQTQRGFRQDVPYILPKDTDEIDRLDLQHYIMRAVLKSNYVAPIETPARILDVGCGTGQWAFDMCHQFPQSQVIGIDLEPGKKMPPHNFYFVQANLLAGLPFEGESFDFIHQRFLLTALPLDTWPKMLAEFKRVSMRGSWVELIEGSDEIEPIGPATQRMVDDMIRFSEKRGLNASTNVPRFLDSLLMQAGFQQVQMQSIKIPLGAWGGRIGEMMATNLHNALKSIGAAFPQYLNTPQYELDEILAQLRPEWENNHTTYRYYIAYGQNPE